MKELIEKLKTHKPNKGIISPLDVENLFTNIMGRVLFNGPGDLGSIPGHVIPKTLK